MSITRHANMDPSPKTPPTHECKSAAPRTQPKKHQTHYGFLRSIGIVCKSTSASSSTRKLKVFVKYEATQNMHSPLPCPLFLVKFSPFSPKFSPQKVQAEDGACSFDTTPFQTASGHHSSKAQKNLFRATYTRYKRHKSTQ